MKEHLHTHNQEISLTQYIAGYRSELQLKGNPLRLVGMTSNRMSWNVLLPKSNSLAHEQSEKSIQLYDSTEAFNEFHVFCQNNHSQSIPKKSQNPGHLAANAFLMANWGQIVIYLSPQPKSKPREKLFFFPEVTFYNKINELGRITNFSIDCIASDYEKNIYVIEVGTRRKMKQNNRQGA